MKILSVLLILPQIAFAEFSLKDGMVQPFQLRDQQMIEFISDYAKVVKRPLLVDQKIIKGKVNFSVGKPITLDDLNKMFITVLSSQGMELIDDEAFMRIIKSSDIRFAPTKFHNSEDYLNSDQYILVKRVLKNPIATEVTRGIRPFISRYGRVISFNDGHTIVLSEKGNNISRTLGVIDNLDEKFDMEKLIANKKAKNKRKREKEEQKDIEIDILKMEKKLLKKKNLELKVLSEEARKQGKR